MRAPDPLYETIGRTYTATRREDPRVRAAIHDAIGPASTVLNVGAGSGNYEPPDALVVAVDPSSSMLGQRDGRSRLVVEAVAEALPFPDRSFDVALAVLTIHHWPDVGRGLRELQRVSRRQVVFFYETAVNREFWLTEYIPEAMSVPSELGAPGEALLRSILRVEEVRTVLVPADCIDGFACAYWNRPEAYADPLVQAGMSWLALQPDDVLRRASDRLLADIESGEWDSRHGHLRNETEFDGGYRIAICS